MEKVLITIFLIFLAICSLKAADNLPDASETGLSSLTEAYIGVYINKYKGDKFFRVFTDEEERPYLPVTEILTEWMELKNASQQLTENKLYFYLNPGKREYSIDYEKYTVSGEKGNFILPENSLKQIENRLWLRYDQFSLWLPADFQWNLNFYALFISRRYRSQGEMQQERIIERENSLDRYEREKIMLASPVIIPQSGAFSARMSCVDRYTKKNREQEKDEELNLEMNFDTGFGTFYLDYDRDFAGGNTKTAVDGLRSLSFNTEDRLGFSDIETGDCFTPNGLTFSGRKLRGFGVRKKASDIFDINLPFRRSFPGGTEIDVFRDGIFQKTMKLEESGFADFRDLKTRSGDNILWKIYYPDGDIREIRLNVPSDRGYIIPEGDLDLYFYSGYDAAVSRDEQTDAGVRFGLGKNTSLGMFYQTQLENRLYPVECTGINLAVIPLHNTFSLFEISRAGSAEIFDQETSVNLRGGQRLSLRNRRKLSGTRLPGISGFENYSLIDRLNFNSSLTGGDLNISFEKKEKQRRATFDYSKALQLGRIGVIRANVGSDADVTGTDDRIRWGIRRKGTQFTLDYDTQLGNANREDTIRLTSSREHRSQLILRRSRASGADDWHLTLENARQTLTWQRQNQSGSIENRIDFETMILSENISLTGKYLVEEKDYEIGVKFTAYFGFSTRKAPSSYRDFRTASVYGKITQDTEQGNIPFAGVIVNIGGSKGISDENGYYTVYGVTPGADVPIQLEGDSFPAYLSPAGFPISVRMRPGTSLKKDITLLETGGIDGFVQDRTGRSGELRLSAARKDGYGKRFEIILEKDGFFVQEGLEIDTEYILRCTKSGATVEQDFIIERGENWKSGIEIIFQ